MMALGLPFDRRGGMDTLGLDMDGFCSDVRRLVEWLNPLPEVPIAFADPGFRQDLVTVPQPFVELYLVTDGVLRLAVQDESQVLRPGDLALANAHFGNVGREVSGPFRYGCVSLEVPDEPRFDDWKRRPLLRSRRAPDPAQAQALYKELAHVYHGPEHPYRGVLLKALLLQLLATTGDTGSRSQGSTQNRHVRRAVEVMTERRGDPALSLPKIARRVGISPSHLVRLFHENLGRSPMRYLTELRVRYARGLLLRSDLSIKEIAFMVGFRDQLYFSRVFRREAGASPRAFRDQGSA
jgi:AraC-like DNA-binding protein